MTVPGRPAPSSTTPSIARRLACLTYEGVLLFGVVMLAGLLFGTVTQQRNAMQHRHGLQAFVFVVLAAYFVWFWSHGGQTVAMKAWHIRLVDARGHAVSKARAFARFVSSWLWFAPALLAVWLGRDHTPGVVAAAILSGMAVYCVLARLLPQRQFLHDIVCGTRLVVSRPPVANDAA